MAFLDQARGGGHRLHGRTGFHVRPVQSLHPPVEKTQGLQPRHIRAEPARHVQKAGAGEAASPGAESGEQGGAGPHPVGHKLLPAHRD